VNLCGAIVTIMIRRVPWMFNESKIIGVSIYNLVILGVFVIPVYFVLTEFNPFAAWMIRTLSILYAFSATLALMFVPKIYGMIIIDKGTNPPLFEHKDFTPKSSTSTPGSAPSTSSGTPSEPTWTSLDDHDRF